MDSEKIYCKYLVTLILILSINPIYTDKKQTILDDIAPTVTVSQYDCSEMSENNLYSLNQVKPCNVAPENIDMSYAKSRCIQNIFEQRLTLPYAASNIRETDSIVECMTIPASISNKRQLPPISIYRLHNSDLKDHQKLY